MCVVVEWRGLARFGLGMSSWRGLPLTQRPPGHLYLLHPRGVESQISLSCGDWRATAATRLANQQLLPQIIMASPTAPTPTTSSHVPTLPWIPFLEWFSLYPVRHACCVVLWWLRAKLECSGSVVDKAPTSHTPACQRTGGLRHRPRTVSPDRQHVSGSGTPARCV